MSGSAKSTSRGPYLSERSGPSVLDGESSTSDSSEMILDSPSEMIAEPADENDFHGRSEDEKMTASVVPVSTPDVPFTSSETRIDSRSDSRVDSRGLKWRVPAVETSLGYRAAKRMLDIAGALVGLAVFGPVMALCALLIRLQDGGAVFFSQVRVGENGEPFRILKFRSMVLNADAMKALLMDQNTHGDARTFKLLNDPRITPVGRWMRRLSLDELPQFWNVLRGDMSLVGPRPALPTEVELYDRSDYIRLAVKPGLTCIWQVSGRSRLDFHQQIQLDLQYIRTRSLWTDVSLILRTLPAVFRGDGAV